MMLAGAALASSALASQTALSTETGDAWATRPLDVSIDDVSWRDWVLVGSLEIDDTLGEQTSCTFTIVNPVAAPVVGNVVQVTYYSEVLFRGTIDQISRATNNTQTARTWRCTCTDWSQILMRHVVRRNFSYVSVQQLVESLLVNELAGEGLTFGTADRATSIPFIDSQSGRLFDLLRDAAGVTGQTLYVDFDKRVQFRATTNDPAPLDLDLDTIETATVEVDRETYRNVQTVVVTGTPAAGVDEFVSVITRQNDDQIAARAALEGGTGRYEAIEEVTHPTSNDGVDCQLLAIGYAQLRLATSGVPRETLKCRARNYGFRAGQFAAVDVSLLGLSGTWLIQRVSLREEDGVRLVHEMELVQSSLQQRAYESWLRIVEAGKIVVQMPSAITSNSVTFNTPGSSQWEVPAGVTLVQVTCAGASGGGAGATEYTQRTTVCIWQNPRHPPHGNGGNSGRAVSIFNVTEGDMVNIVVGSAGTAGVNGEIDLTGDCNPFYEGTPVSGGSGGLSSITYLGSIKCQGNGGGGGQRYQAGGADGGAGSGVGDAISVGGGVAGGYKGELGDATHMHGPAPDYPFAPAPGGDGWVQIAW